MKIIKSFNKAIRTALIGILFYTFNLNAFYYEEHKLITQQALDLAISLNYLEIDQDKIKEGLGSTFLCNNLMNPNPKDCFTLADLPAVAGDHAGSPMLLQWKWFNDTRKKSSIIPAVDYLASARVVFEKECQSSETTISKIPNRKEFALLMHRDHEATSFGEASEVDEHDSNYIRSAAHNCNHFRDTNIDNLTKYSNEIVKSQVTNIWNKPVFVYYPISKYISFLQSDNRERAKPSLEAGIWYAQLHATALELASREGATNLAAAWIFETFALHFIQDGVASGHIDTSNFGGISVVDTKTQHDYASKNGLSVTIDGACNALNNEYANLSKFFTKLTHTCQQAPFKTVLYGDRNLIEKSDSPTQDLAVFLTLVSLHEFGQAIKDKQPLMEEQVPLDNFKDDPHWTFQGQGDGKLAETLFAWWESNGQVDASSPPMVLAAKKHLEKGNISALFMWPIPADKD